MKENKYRHQRVFFNEIICLSLLLISVATPIVASSDLEVDNLTVSDGATFYGDVIAGQMTGSAPTNDLIMYFNFSTNSSVVADESGNSNTGVVSGATWSTNGISGGAFSFDGNDDIITVTAGLGDVYDRSVSLWIKKAEAIGAGSMGIYNNINVPRYHSLMFHSSLGEGVIGMILHTSTPDCKYIKATEGIVDTDWHHIVFTRQGTNTYIYIDTVQYSAYWYGSGTPSGVVSVSGYPVVLGKYDPADYFNGLMDEVRVYDRVLSDSEIQGLYYHDHPSTPGAVRFESGVEYTAELGDLPMGIYTNQP